MNELFLNISQSMTATEKNEFMKDRFPTVGESHELIELWVNDSQYGFICLEYQSDVCVLHLYIFKEHRTEEKIKHLVRGFTEAVHPWVKERGSTKIMVQCPYENTKTMELFKTFGYVPFAVWVGIMEI